MTCGAAGRRSTTTVACAGRLVFAAVCASVHMEEATTSAKIKANCVLTFSVVNVKPIDLALSSQNYQTPFEDDVAGTNE